MPTPWGNFFALIITINYVTETTSKLSAKCVALVLASIEFE